MTFTVVHTPQTISSGIFLGRPPQQSQQCCPLLRKVPTVAGLEPHARTLMCCCCVHLPCNKFPRLYQMALVLEFALRDTSGKGNSLSLDKKNCHQSPCSSAQLTKPRPPPRCLPHLTAVSGNVWTHLGPRAARGRPSGPLSERKVHLNTWRQTHVSGLPFSKTLLPTPDMNLYFHFLDYFLVITRT